MQTTSDNYLPTYTDCEFEEIFTTPSVGVANSTDYPDFKFALKIKDGPLSYNNSRQICSDFGNLPEFL
jgi:hypothetical protein